MKSERQNKILQLIKENVVETQEEILSYLREHGYDVTQATVSRDIRRLQLVKVQTADGHYRYAPAARAHTKEGTAGLHAIVSQTVQKVDGKSCCGSNCCISRRKRRLEEHRQLCAENRRTGNFD